ncbi:MAG: hypothetical protein GY940_36065 [bacterium]|nr:hypothetical protein [bacterium]
MTDYKLMKEECVKEEQTEEKLLSTMNRLNELKIILDIEKDSLSKHHVELAVKIKSVSKRMSISFGVAATNAPGLLAAIEPGRKAKNRRNREAMRWLGIDTIDERLEDLLLDIPGSKKIEVEKETKQVQTWHRKRKKKPWE